MRQDTRQAVRAIKERVRAEAFTISDRAFADMVAQVLDAADIKRAVSTARLAGVFRAEPRGAGYILHGFGMDEEPIEVLCRAGRARVEITGVVRL
jgi:hypothetical protein